MLVTRCQFTILSIISSFRIIKNKLWVVETRHEHRGVNSLPVCTELGDPSVEGSRHRLHLRPRSPWGVHVHCPSRKGKQSDFWEMILPSKKVVNETAWLRPSLRNPIIGDITFLKPTFCCRRHLNEWVLKHLKKNHSTVHVILIE